MYASMQIATAMKYEYMEVERFTTGFATTAKNISSRIYPNFPLLPMII
jgi:hypothetical protein